MGIIALVYSNEKLTFWAVYVLQEEYFHSTVERAAGP
jgi:hypothetical protein